ARLGAAGAPPWTRAGEAGAVRVGKDTAIIAVPGSRRRVFVWAGISTLLYIRSGTICRLPRDPIGLELCGELQCPADRSSSSPRASWPMFISASPLQAY